MEGQIPDEAKSDQARLPLVELPATDAAGAPIPTETPGKSMYLVFYVEI